MTFVATGALSVNYLFTFWIIFHAFLLSADFFQSQCFKKNISGTDIRVSNSLDPDQAQCFVWPVLGPYCLPRLSAEDTRRQSFKKQIRLYILPADILYGISGHAIPDCN